MGASCHNLEEVKHASRLKLDYIFLGPVLKKGQSKSNILGWDRFAELTLQSKIPVYAIGGLNAADIETSICNGGQGIAAIRSVWGYC